MDFCVAFLAKADIRKENMQPITPTAENGTVIRKTGKKFVATKYIGMIQLKLDDNATMVFWSELKCFFIA